MIHNVAVVGAGTMGIGIAHTFAMHGYRVMLVDMKESFLLRAAESIAKNLDRQVQKGSISLLERGRTISNIEYTDLLETGVTNCELVVEAIPENRNIKIDFFTKIPGLCRKDTIFASNTSSISITELGRASGFEGQVIGMHFMNPVPLMALVEVVNGKNTYLQVTQSIIDVTKSLGKTPVVVNDRPGFVANRILMPMLNEAFFALQDGVAGVIEIDTIMKLGTSFPMGPLELADFIGLDVCHSILTVLESGFNAEKYKPCTLLTKMVAANKLGVKSGEGFYKYTPGSKEKLSSNISWSNF